MKSVVLVISTISVLSILIFFCFKKREDQEKAETKSNGMVVTAYSIDMSIEWFRNKVKEIFKNRSVSKVVAGYLSTLIVVSDLSKMVDNCNDTIDMSKIEEYLAEGYDNFIIAVDPEGHTVGDLELIQNTDSMNKISKLYKDEGMVVINR